MEILGDNFGAKKGEKGQKKYYCTKCDFECCKKYSWDRHLNTLKHQNDINGDIFEGKKGEKGQKCIFKCNFCEREYHQKRNLWRHNKICGQNDNKINEKDNYHNNDNDKLIEHLMKENKEMKELILEIVKTGTTNNSHNTTNSHNKAFNLNFFLNETCKNAMNITDFVDSIKLQLADFINVGELGFVEGISNIIAKNLNSLDETIRPIHCTDQKRETFYVKDQDKWEKEEQDKKRIKKMIKKVAFKNENLMRNFKDVYPDYNDPNSKRSDQYSKTVIEAMGGIGNNDDDKETKIIKNIKKEVIIDKNIKE